jgi:glycosyltransferase involved in cell wall biosynthesis
MGSTWFRAFLGLPGKKRLLLLTNALRRELGEAYQPFLPESQVLITPSGVDLERFDNLPDPKTARGQLKLPEFPTVVCAGHLYPGRGADLFLNLAARMPGVHFLWVGGDPTEVESWRGKAREMDPGSVTFQGFVPNQVLPLYLAAADVLIMPYQSMVAGSSGGDIAAVFSPLKMFEYMAAGRAILCSDLPALREVLSDETAVFCAPGDADAWQDSLSRLLKQDDMRKRLSQAASLAVKNHTWLERTRRAVHEFG